MQIGNCLPSKKLQIGFFCFSYLAKIIGWFQISDICRLFSFAKCNCIYLLEFYDLSISSDLMENSSDLSPRRIFRISKIVHAKLFHCVRLFIREFLNNQRQQSYQSFELFQFFFCNVLSPLFWPQAKPRKHMFHASSIGWVWRMDIGMCDWRSRRRWSRVERKRRGNKAL